MNNVLEIKNVEKIYNTKEGEIKALDKINLNIPNGKIIAFVGPSGCGKSTLLSLISELDTDYTGIIKKDKISISDFHPKISLLVQNKRDGVQGEYEINFCKTKKPRRAFYL